MAAQPALHNSTLKTIENEMAFALGIDVHIVNHGSGDCPALLRNLFAGNNQLVEVHGPDLTKFNIRTQAGADVGIVWTQRPNEILMKCAGGTPSVRKKAIVPLCSLCAPFCFCIDAACVLGLKCLCLLILGAEPTSERLSRPWGKFA